MQEITSTSFFALRFSLAPACVRCSSRSVWCCKSWPCWPHQMPGERERTARFWCVFLWEEFWGFNSARFNMNWWCFIVDYCSPIWWLLEGTPLVLPICMIRMITLSGSIQNLAIFGSGSIWSYRLKTISGWWFGTFFIFPYIGNNHPNWLIFFRGVQTTNQIWESKEMFDVHLLQTKAAGGGFRSVGGPWIRYLMVTRFAERRTFFPGQKKMNTLEEAGEFAGKTVTYFHISDSISGHISDSSQTAGWVSLL